MQQETSSANEQSKRMEIASSQNVKMLSEKIYGKLVQKYGLVELEGGPDYIAQVIRDFFPFDEPGTVGGAAYNRFSRAYNRFSRAYNRFSRAYNRFSR